MMNFPLAILAAMAIPAPALPDAAAVQFNAETRYSPTYSSGYYYATPYSGYTSLRYYGSLYTARRYG